MARARPKDLGQQLLDSGLVDEEGLGRASVKAEKEGLSLDRALVEAGVVAETDLLQVLSEQNQIPVVDLEEIPLSTELAELLPQAIARRYLALPLYKKGHTIVVAMAQAWDVARVDEVRFSIGRSIRPVLAPREELRRKIDELFTRSSPRDKEPLTGKEVDYLQNALEEIDDTGIATSDQEEDQPTTQQLLQESSASPIVKIVNDILIRAIQKGASDIHIEPQEGNVNVRLRVDGALREEMRLPLKVRSAVVSRIKVLADMDISVARRPQDGRIKLHYRDDPLDLRVSTLPTYWGEKVVMRVLDQQGVGLDLEKLGFLRGERELIERIMRQTQGMLLVTGPTGSGKSTTLYSILSAINQEDVNIITVEDPVEYQLPKINQVPVNPKAGMTFATGLRSILRQDPNVIMVGEIRDQETAEIALESAETGHMVFSTLHTNSAAGAITRFLDMEVPTYLLASSLSAVLAQRLLRRNCPDCAEPVEIGEGLRVKYNIPEDVTFYEGKGCPACDAQGTKGRIGAYELLVADRDVREAISEGLPEAEVVDRARANGMHLMFEDGLIKAMQGKVSLPEVLRALELPAGIEVDAGRLWEEADLSMEERARGGASGEGGAPRPGHALVVTGEESLRKVVAMILEADGLEVETVESGRKALDLIRQKHPGLVVAETETPDLDGIALAESLRRDSALTDIPLVLLAEGSDVRLEARALAAGADELLGKPLDPERLLARVRRLRTAYSTLLGRTSA